MRKFIFLFGLLIPVILRPYQTVFYRSIIDYLHNYRRAATILEICATDKCYSVDLARNFPKHIFVLVVADSSNTISFSSHLPSNLIVLKPKYLPNSALDILARCEHFDMVMVQELNNLKSYHDGWYSERLKLFLQLGNDSFIESNQRQSILDGAQPRTLVHESHFLYSFHIPKCGIDIARWNLHYRPRSETCPYKIESSFNEKFLIKREQKSEWIPGINLITFIMLGGIYPSNDVIVQELKRYKKLRHNDLVVGNFIIQGMMVRPIDFNDARRRVPAKKSLKAIIKLFKQKLRYEDPQGSLNLYQKWVNKYL